MLDDENDSEFDGSQLDEDLSGFVVGDDEIIPHTPQTGHTQLTPDSDERDMGVRHMHVPHDMMHIYMLCMYVQEDWKLYGH